MNSFIQNYQCINGYLTCVHTGREGVQGRQGPTGRPGGPGPFGRPGTAGPTGRTGATGC